MKGFDKLYLYIRLLFLVDGTADYGRAIRWCYLLGQLGKDPKATRRVESLDMRNFKKWRKLNDNKSFDDYLKVARV